MKLDNMFKKTRLHSGRKNYIDLGASRPEVPEGLLRKCNKCGGAIITEDVKNGYYIKKIRNLSNYLIFSRIKLSLKLV